MRVLQIVHNFPPEFRGGVERYVEQLTDSLTGLGQRVSVICGSESSAESASVSEEIWNGVSVFRMVRRAVPRTPLDPFDPELVELFEDLLDEIGPHVVHVHHWWNLGDDLVRRATSRGFPVIVTLHDAFATCGLFFRLPDGENPCDLPQTPDHCAPCVGARHGLDEGEVRHQVAFRRSSFEAELKAAVRVLTPSAAHGAVLTPLLGRALRSRVLPLGSRSFGAPLPTLPDPSGPRLRILHFGNLSRLKGVEILARAVELADPSGDRITLTLAGERVESGLDLGRGRTTGLYERDEMASLAQQADLAVFPSLARESYGLVVDEALRLGLPVLVSDRGALSERIGDRGMVVPAGDADALARVLIDFLEDPGSLQTLREASEPDLPTPEEHASALLEIYATARKAPLPAVDLQSPLLARIAHLRDRMGEMMEYLKRTMESREQP